MDRRNARRVPFVASVIKEVGTERRLALATNLGETGIALRRIPERDYPRHMRLDLTFELPDGGDLIRVRGFVVHERADGNYHATGVHFEHVSPGDQERITRFLDNHR